MHLQRRPVEKMTNNNVLIVGAGIGGLTLALHLERRGIACTILEVAPTLRPLGVGINVMPHASRELAAVGIEAELDSIGIQTSNAVFYNRFGQLIYAEPAGRSGGHPWPQYSVHRGLLQDTLARTVRERLGDNAIQLDRKVIDIRQDSQSATVVALDSDAKEFEVTGSVIIGCDGVHSVVRKHLHPTEGALNYTGYTMWRGTTRMPPFLDGASMVRAGWLETGKMVIYPIHNYEDGSQQINWVAEVAMPQRAARDWTLQGDADAFSGSFDSWTFDWLDVPSMIRDAEAVLEYPMLDQDPLPFWTSGRVTLLGDAAHPMAPRGSNGAGQAILDASELASALAGEPNAELALANYEAVRRPKTAEVVRMNRTNPPDAVLREVFERTGDQRFDDVNAVISKEEIGLLLDTYRSVTGSSRQTVGVAD